jgi:murein DD-endopeptidase MepM/ murein hydrolase activator NlpD
MILLSCSLGGILFILFEKPYPTAIKETNQGTLPLKESKPQKPETQMIEGQIMEGGSFFQSLRQQNISPQWIDLIVSKLKPHVNFKKIKGGSYQFITDGQGEFVKFIYQASPTEVYEVEKETQGYIAQRREIPLASYWVKVVGEIHSSLFEAMDAIGEQDPLTIAFAEALAWEIDFYKDGRQGDRFKVVVEKIYNGNHFIKYGLIHAVEYQRGERLIRGIRYRDDFYTEKGISLKKAFLKAPLRFNRISSRFSQGRRHPILGGVRPHFGVDYAAPPGTSVWAVADGAILSCGWNGGYGKQVILRHRNGYTTYYGHLSGYASGIRKGTAVRQKQIIGYVGSTGLSTGPHLDYRLAKDGRFRNPLREGFPTGNPIGKGEMETFQKRRDEMLTWLQGESPFQKRIEEEGQR